MADNIEIKPLGIDVGGYKAGTVMATKQNADQSHSTRVVIDGVFSSSDPLLVQTINDGYKSALNSTVLAGVSLAPGETWSGAFDSPLDYGGVRVIVYSTQASATNGLKVYCSNDGSSSFLDDQYTIPATTVKTFAATVSPYVKVTYTNGSQAAILHVCTLFLKNMSVVSSHRIQDNLVDDDDGQLTVSVLKLRTAQNNYVSGAATNAGNFKVSIEEIDSSVTIPTQPSDNLTMSEFGEQRVANPGNRSDVEFIYDKQPLLMDDISTGGGTAVHQTNGRDILLSIVNNTTGTVAGLRQHYAVPYTPGSGQEIDITGTLDASAIGGGEAEVFLRSKVTGTVIEQTIPQSSWLAKTSGVDWTKSQIFRISFQSLKVGRIQFALVPGGVPVKVAEITNDNLRTTGYWQYASLPPYWMIYNDSQDTAIEFGYGDDDNAVGFRYWLNGKQATATARAICETVKSQGGALLLDMPGFPFSADRGANGITVSTSLIPILSIRVASLYNTFTNRSLVIPTALDIQTDNPLHFQVLYRPTLTATTWTAANSNSGVEYNTDATAVSGGIKVASGYVATQRNVPASQVSFLGRTVMALGYAGAADILTLAAVRTSTTNCNAYAALQWKEIR